MRRVSLLFLSVLGLALPAGCQRDDSQVGDKLDQIIKQNDEILRALQAGAARGPAAGRGAADRAAPPRPSPADVYAVSAAGPVHGAKDAKITIVEAFTFT
jgi:hypothetical protein